MVFNFLNSSHVIIFSGTSLIQGTNISCLDFSTFLTGLPKSTVAASLIFLAQPGVLWKLKSHCVTSCERPVKGFHCSSSGWLICEALRNLAPASVLFLQSLQVPSSNRVIPHLSHVPKRYSPAGWLSALPVIPHISSQGHLLRYLPIKIGRLHAPIVSFLAIYFCELPVHLWRCLISLYRMTWSSQYLSALELNATITCWVNDWIGLLLIYSYVSSSVYPRTVFRD